MGCTLSRSAPRMGVIVAVCLAVANLSPAREKEPNPAPGRPDIDKTINEFHVPEGCDAGTRDCDRIRIEGIHLHLGVEPEAALGELPLAIQEMDGEGNVIVVELPSVTPDGTHRLRLTTENGYDEFEHAVGAVGAEGPPGFTGDPGPAGPPGTVGALGAEGPTGQSGSSLIRSKENIYKRNCDFRSTSETRVLQLCFCDDERDVAISGICDTLVQIGGQSRLTKIGTFQTTDPSGLAGIVCSWADVDNIDFLVRVECIDADLP
jgi:hypothetical protein